FYRLLKKCYPKDKIHFLSADSLASFEDGDFCEEKKLITKAAKRLGPEFFRLAEELKAEKYDLAISLTPSFSSSFLLWKAQIPFRVGFAQSGSQLFLTDSLPWKGIKSGKHKTEVYLDLLRFLTGQSFHLDLPHYGNAPISSKLILIAPGASIELRVWPYFRELTRELSVLFPDYEIRWVGGKGEAHWHQEIEKWPYPNVTDMIEKTTLSQLVDGCRQSCLVIANDSGVAHLAGTLAQVPTLVLFGPGDPNYIRPLGPRIHCQTPSSVPCHPCEKPYCHSKYGYQACLREISWETVVNQVKSWIPS
ncbi:MAG: glycosyltransferase family 9 protein, partial [Deltaproteobacteria bacterium]